MQTIEHLKLIDQYLGTATNSIPIPSIQKPVSDQEMLKSAPVTSGTSQETHYRSSHLSSTSDGQGNTIVSTHTASIQKPVSDQEMLKSAPVTSGTSQETHYNHHITIITLQIITFIVNQ